MTRRMEKIGDQLQLEIAELLHRRVKHPVLQGTMVSITHVEVSPDLGTARVHVSVIGSEHPETDVIAALERSEPFLHRELVKRLRMRRVPRLRFRVDHSMAEADRISALLREVAGTDGTGPSGQVVFPDQQ